MRLGINYIRFSVQSMYVLRVVEFDINLVAASKGTCVSIFYSQWNRKGNLNAFRLNFSSSEFRNSKNRLTHLTYIHCSRPNIIHTFLMSCSDVQTNEKKTFSKLCEANKNKLLYWNNARGWWGVWYLSQKKTTAVHLKDWWRWICLVEFGTYYE